MPSTLEKIEARLQEAFPRAQISVKDFLGDGTYAVLRVKSPAFKGLSLIQQHQAVHKALGPLQQEVHAVTIKTEPLEDTP